MDCFKRLFFFKILSSKNATKRQIGFEGKTNPKNNTCQKEDNES